MSQLRCANDLTMETKRYQGFSDASSRWDRAADVAEYHSGVEEAGLAGGEVLMDIVSAASASGSATGRRGSGTGRGDFPSTCVAEDPQRFAFPLLGGPACAALLDMDSEELSKTVAESMDLYMNAVRELDYSFGQQGTQGAAPDIVGKPFPEQGLNPKDSRGSPKVKPLDLLSTGSYPMASHPSSASAVDRSLDVHTPTEALVSALGGTQQNFGSSVSSPASNSLASSTTSVAHFGSSGSSLGSPVHQASLTPGLALAHRRRVSASGSPASMRNAGSPLASPCNAMRSPLSSPQSSIKSPPSCNASVRSVSSPTGSGSMQTQVSSPTGVSTAAVSSPPSSAGFSVPSSGGGCNPMPSVACTPERVEQDFKGFEFPKVEKVDGELYSVGLDPLGVVKYIKNEPTSDSRTMCLSGGPLNVPCTPFSMQIKSEPNKDVSADPHYNGQQHSLNVFPASETTYLSLRDNFDEYSLSGILGPPVSFLNGSYQTEVFPDDVLPKGIKQESKENSYCQGNNNSVQASAIVGVNSSGHSFHYQIGAQGTMSFSRHDVRDQSNALLNLISPVSSLMETWKSRSGLPQNSLSSQGEVYPGQQCISDISSSLRNSSSGSTAAKVCLVCGDEASGCHYGVVTCGSCKVFFKRAVEGQHNYLCAGRNDCIIDKIRRKNCPACRVRKCLQAGMNLGARKSKKLGKLRSVSEGAGPGPREDAEAEPGRGTALVPLSPGVAAHLSPSICNVLELIEPEVVYAGYDNTQPDTTDHLLSSLNRLAGKQMIRVVKWAKVLPGFRSLPIEDQITLIQYSWMCLSSFALSWRSYKHTNGQMLYFAPDLVFNEERMQQSAMYDLCLGMRQVSQEFVRLQLTHEEYLAMKVLLLLSTVPKEGLKNQVAFEEMRVNYIKELRRCVARTTSHSGQTWPRFYQLTRLLDAMHDLVGNLLDFCFYTFRESQALKVEFPEMLVEIISDQLPKVESGQTRTLYFHKK